MANTITLTDANVQLDNSGGTLQDISSQVESVTINYGTNTDTVNAMGDDTEINASTLKTWTASITVFQEYGAGNVDDIVFNALGNVVSFQANPNGASTSATNPQYTGEGIVTSWNPIDNAHGEVQRATIEIAAAGTLSRSTT